MSYTSEDGQTVHFRLMDGIKPRVTRLAVALKFPDYVIDDMETKRDPVLYLLKEWLRGGNQEHDSRPLTWGTLITALRAAGLSEEADILEQYFVAAPTQVAVRGGMAYVHTVMIVTDCSYSSVVYQLSCALSQQKILGMIMILVL